MSKQKRKKRKEKKEKRKLCNKLTVFVYVYVFLDSIMSYIIFPIFFSKLREPKERLRRTKR